MVFNPGTQLILSKVQWWGCIWQQPRKGRGMTAENVSNTSWETEPCEVGNLPIRKACAQNKVEYCVVIFLPSQPLLYLMYNLMAICSHTVRWPLPQPSLSLRIDYGLKFPCGTAGFAGTLPRLLALCLDLSCILSFYFYLNILQTASLGFSESAWTRPTQLQNFSYP